MISSFEKKVYRIVRQIPKGRITTYKGVAEAINCEGGARAVGNALHKNRDRSVPCHRVILSNGGVGGYAWGMGRKTAILKKEGIKIQKSRIDMKRFYFQVSR